MCWIRSMTLFVGISLTLGTRPASAASPEPAAAAVIRRVAWFAQAGFPPPPAAPLVAEDGAAIRAAFAGAGWEVEELDAAALARPERLNRDRFDLLFLPYGACFPEEAHENVVRFHQAGGHLFWFGAAAGRPVRWEEGQWRHWPLGQHYNLGGPYQADFGLSWSRWGNDHQPVTLTPRAHAAFPAVPLPESLGRIGYCHLLSRDDFRWTSAYQDTVVLPLWESRPGDRVTGHGAVLIRHHDPDFPDGTTLIAFGTPDPPKLQGDLTADVIVQLARLCVTPLEGDLGSTLHAARIRVLDRAEQLAEVWSQATWAVQDMRAMAPSDLKRQADHDAVGQASRLPVDGRRPDWESLSSECLDAMDLARELDYGDPPRKAGETPAPRLRSVFDLPPQSLEQYRALARELERLRAQCEPFAIPARSEEPAAGPEADEPVLVGTCAPEVGYNGPVRFLRTAAKARRFGLDHFLGFALWWAPDLELSADPPSSPSRMGGWEQRTASLRFQSQLAQKSGLRLILMFAQPNLILDGRADGVLRKYQPRPAEADMATGELQELPAEPGASPYPWWDWDWGPWMEDEFPRWVEALITLRLRDDPSVFGYNQVNEWSLTRWWQHGRWLTDFREFLRRRYGSVDRLNEAWGTTFADWAEVQPPRRFPRDWATLEALPAELPDHAAWYDWARFRVEILTRCHRLLYEAVKRADPQRPLISRDSFGDLVRGIDLSRLARLCDYFGVHYAPYPGHLAYAQSMAGNRPLLLSEYYWDGFTFQPPDRYSAARLREGMWTAMAHGAVGFQFFNWFINRGAWTSGDGVFSILADSSDHVGAPAFELARMKEQSARFLRVVREGHPARRPVAILQPLSSHLNRTGADIPGMPPWISPAGTYFWTLYGTWEMAELAGHQSDFLTEEQITPETLRRYRVVLVPFCDFLPGSTTEALLQFVRAGGTLFAPAHTGLWDEYGRRNGRLQQAAGVTVARTPARDLPVGKQTWHFEWDAYTCRIAPTPGNKHYRSRLRFPPYEGGMKGGSADGSDAVAVTRLGRGKIVWSGVNLGHECYRWAEACFMHKDNEEYPVRRAAYHHYLAALWPELGLAVEEPFVRDQPEVELVPWEWQGNTYLFAINHSWQRPTAVRLGVRGPYRAVTDLLLEARIPLRQGRFATWLDAGQGRVFRLEPQK